MKFVAILVATFAALKASAADLEPKHVLRHTTEAQSEHRQLLNGCQQLACYVQCTNMFCMQDAAEKFYREKIGGKGGYHRESTDTRGGWYRFLNTKFQPSSRGEIFSGMCEEKERLYTYGVQNCQGVGDFACA